MMPTTQSPVTAEHLAEWKALVESLRQFERDYYELPDEQKAWREAAAAIERSVAEVERLRADLVEERTAVRELQRECNEREDYEGR